MGKGIPKSTREKMRPFWNLLDPVLDELHHKLISLTPEELLEVRAAAQLCLEATSGHRSGKTYWTSRIIDEQLGKQAADAHVVFRAQRMELDADDESES